MAGCDIFMSNLNIILSKVDELTEIRDKVNKVKKNSGPSLLGDILDEKYVKDMLKDLGTRARCMIDEFRQLKHEKEQEMEEYCLEGEDQDALDKIINGQKEAQSIVNDIEELLSPNRQATPHDVAGKDHETGAVAVGNIETGDVVDRDCEPESVTVRETEPEIALQSVPTVSGPSSASESTTSSKTRAKPQCPRDAIQWYHDIYYFMILSPHTQLLYSMKPLEI